MIDQDVRLSQIQHLDRTGEVNILDPTSPDGQGGYSDVWRGTWRSRAGTQEVAVKQLRVLTRDCADIETLCRRFYREILAWDRLDHENILPLLGFALANNRLPWLISPWYRNGNIIRYLRFNPQVQRPPLLLHITNGLGYLHSLHLVHGDLKGENILVDDSGSARICDFGMTKFIDDTIRIANYHSSDGAGTPCFLAPEILRGIPKSKKSDTWAFGCVVIQVLTDQLPYARIRDPHAVRRAIDSGQPPLSKRYEAENPFWNGIRQCWARDPDSRPDITMLSEHIRISFFNNGGTSTGFGKGPQPHKQNTISSEAHLYLSYTASYNPPQLQRMMQQDGYQPSYSGSVRDTATSSSSDHSLFSQHAPSYSHKNVVYRSYSYPNPTSSSSGQGLPHPVLSYPYPHNSPQPSAYLSSPQLSTGPSTTSNYSTDMVYPSTDPSPVQRDEHSIPAYLPDIFTHSKAFTNDHPDYNIPLFPPIAIPPDSTRYIGPSA